LVPPKKRIQSQKLAPKGVQGRLLAILSTQTYLIWLSQRKVIQTSFIKLYENPYTHLQGPQGPTNALDLPNTTKNTKDQNPNYDGPPPETPTKFTPPTALPRKLAQLPTITYGPSESPIGARPRPITVKIPIPQATKTQRKEFKQIEVEPMDTTTDLVNHLVNEATKQIKLSGHYNPPELTKDSKPKSFKQILKHPLKDQ